MKYKSSGLVLITLVFSTLSLLLAGCISMSADVTPPPADSPPATLVPTVIEPTQPPAETAPEAGDDPEVIGEPGLVTVEVVDQTGGFLLAEGLSVSIEGYDQFDLVFQSTQELPPSAVARFSDVPIQAGRVFFASVAYGGAIYRSEILQAGDETSSLDLQVQIFDTTTDSSGLIIDRLHLLFDFPAPDLVQVSEIYILSNLGSETVVAESPGLASVEFSLPAGAQDLIFEDGTLGQRFLLTEGGFGDTVSIPPGQGVYQVVVSYTLPYDRNRLNFEQQMNYPLAAHVVLLPAVGVEVKNTTLQDMGVQSLPDSEIQVFSGGNIARNEVLAFRLTGNPYGSQDGTLLTGEHARWLVIGLGILGAGLLATGIWIYLKNRTQEAESGPPDRKLLDRDQILDSIIALEDLFQAGEITEAAFEEKRDQLKAQLREISGNE